MVVAMIAQLAISFQRTGLPYVAVVLDDSPSMTTWIVPEKRPQPRSAKRLAAGRADGADAAQPLELGRDAADRATGRAAGRPGRGYKLRFYFLTGMKASRRGGRAGIVEELQAAEPAGDSTRAGRRRPHRAGRSARHRPGGHRAADRRHQHRGALAGRGRRCPRAAACRCSSSAWAAIGRSAS